MIDIEQIRRERTWKGISVQLLFNAPQILLLLYGLKCIATLHGEAVLTVGRAVRGSAHFVPVSGTVAAIAGWQYVGLGLFLYLSDGRPPGENRVWLWRLGRGLLRWGGLAGAMCCFVEADKLLNGRQWNLAGFPPWLLIKIAVFIAGMIASLFFLLAMFQREQVKRDLEDRGFKPLHIWWRPAAYWMCRFFWNYWWPTGFRVVYSDDEGFVHKAHCFVFRSFLRDWRWGNRRVRWLTDRVIGAHPPGQAILKSQNGVNS
jgi:hypothetical protein